MIARLALVATLGLLLAGCAAVERGASPEAAAGLPRLQEASVSVRGVR